MFDINQLWSMGTLEEGVVVHGKDGTGCVLHRPNSSREFSKVDLERIVACVNACKGIKDPSFIPEALAIMKVTSGTFDVLMKPRLDDIQKETKLCNDAILDVFKSLNQEQ